MRKVLAIVMLMTSLSLMADDSLMSDTLTRSELPESESWLKRTLRKFTEIDTNYVEPQHYNWALMVQGTYNYDIYRLSTSGKNEQSVTFAPAPTFKFGPYFGWRWIFFGYTIHLAIPPVLYVVYFFSETSSSTFPMFNSLISSIISFIISPY